MVADIRNPSRSFDNLHPAFIPLLLLLSPLLVGYNLVTVINTFLHNSTTSQPRIATDLESGGTSSTSTSTSSSSSSATSTTITTTSNNNQGTISIQIENNNNNNNSNFENIKVVEQTISDSIVVQQQPTTAAATETTEATTTTIIKQDDVD